MAQPFFTTIPIAIGTTGQGTGLGLSLSYDIIKAHGGTITVNTHYCPPGGDISAGPLGKVESIESYPHARAGSNVNDSAG